MRDPGHSQPDGYGRCPDLPLSTVRPMPLCEMPRSVRGVRRVDAMLGKDEISVAGHVGSESILTDPEG